MREYFFIIILIIYLMVNIYTVIKLSHHLSFMKKSIYARLFTLLCGFLFIISRILLAFYKNNFIIMLLTFGGGLFLGFLNYMFFIFIFIDLIYIVNKYVKFHNINDTLLYRTGIALAVSIVFISHLNIWFFTVKKYELKTDKNITDSGVLKIVGFSDLHISNISSGYYLKNVINKINELNPDIIILGGDILDRDVKEINQDKFRNLLKLLKAKYGVFAALGNHEYYGNLEKSIEFIESCGIKLLIDEVYEQDDFYLIGRHDRHLKKRKPLYEIIKDMNQEKYSILIEHTPNPINESIENKINLQFSGHTHNGQFFPWNIVTHYMYEIDRGIKKKEDTNFIVSSGIGYWGPPIRNFTRPEIVEIIIKK